MKRFVMVLGIFMFIGVVSLENGWGDQASNIAKISEWKQQLTSDEWKDRERAAIEIGKSRIDAKQVVLPLRDCLRDEEWKVRKAAAYALETAGKASIPAVTALTRALHDEEWRVRKANAYLHKVPLLTIRTGLVRDEDSGDYPEMPLPMENVKNIRIETMNVLPYKRSLKWDDIRDSVWDGFLFAETNPSPYRLANTIDILDFGAPTKRMVSFEFDASDAQPILLLQSYSLNLHYGSKIKEMSRRIYTSTTGLRVWASPILDAASQHIVPIVQTDPAVRIHDTHGYLLEHPQGSYALMICVESLPNDSIASLLESFSPISDSN